MKNIHILGGGTFSDVRNHLSLAARAFGTTARILNNILCDTASEEYDILCHLTKMADYNSALITNDDVANLIETLKNDPQTRVIIMNAALCDYNGTVLKQGPSPDPTKSGPHERRLKTSSGERLLRITPADKIIGNIRKERKDIFVVGFKTTTGATQQEQYIAGLDLLKKNSINLVLANDTVTRKNMIITPEESQYCYGEERSEVLKRLCEILLARINNTFTRSTVVSDHGVDWSDSRIPENLRTVVQHCIDRGAYKPFNGATVGHFAAKVDKETIITSRRKKNFNKLPEEGMVLVKYDGNDRVEAYGGKPSVGGQSQRIIFEQHPDADCIVHFHSPLREEKYSFVPVTPQWQNECGSHQCGANTSKNMKSFEDYDVKAVMLDNHGPNIAFSKDVPAEKVISFIETHFDLEQKTGGPVS